MVVGDRGEHVARFQADLGRIGLVLPAAETDRQYFGPATRRAVLRLQSAYGLPVTGVADDATRVAAASAPTAAFATSSAPADRPAFSALAAPATAPRVFRGPAPTLAADRTAPPDGRRLISGRILAPPGGAAGGLTVAADAHGLRERRQVGSAVAHDGRFEITYPWPGDGEILVSLRVIAGDGTQTLATDVRRHGPEDLDWDLVLPGASPYGPSEWEHLATALTPLLGDVAPADLRPPATGHRSTAGAGDFAVLAAAAGLEVAAVAAWATSARLAGRSAAAGVPVPAEVIFAFLRQDLPVPLTGPLLRNLHRTEGAEVVGGRLLERLGAMDPGAQQVALGRAAAGNLIGTDLTGARATDALAALRARVAGGGLVKGRRAAAKEAVRPGDGTPDPLATALAGITRDHAPLVRALMGRMAHGEIGSLPDLARLSPAQWQAILTAAGPDGEPIGTPPNLDGETAGERAELYAAILDRELERRFPTPSFAAKLGRSERSPLATGAAVAEFLTAHPDLDLARTRVDTFLAERPEALGGIADPEGVRRDLKTAQRLFKLAPTHGAVETLLGHGFDSARAIAAVDEATFADALRDSPVNAIQAREIHRRARTTNALALAVLGTYNRALDGVRFAALPPGLTAAGGMPTDAALPDLQTLFGSLDSCACPQCRSVTSPAAYFVDIMRFLGERPATGAPNAAAVLLARRPDLGEIELSCANTETELPYIDLVNEILEDAVAPPAPVPLHGVVLTGLTAGPAAPALLAAFDLAKITMSADARVLAPDSRGRWTIRDGNASYALFAQGPAVLAQRTRQSTRTTTELLAQPEHVNDRAYQTVARAVAPLDLPFDLAWEQTRTYLSHLGVEQPDLLRLFQQVEQDFTTSPGRDEIGFALLGVPPAERGVLTAAPGAGPWQQVWGLAVPVPATPAGQLADRAGLTFAQLAQLLDMRFVDPDRRVAIAPAAGAPPGACDPARLLVTGLTPEVLDRAQRFLRLWRRLGGAMWDVDKALLHLGGPPGAPASLTADGVTRLADLERLRRRTGLDWPDVLALFDDIEHLPYVDRERDDAPAVPTLYERLFRSPLLGGESRLAADPAQLSGTVGDHVPVLLAAFGLSEAQLLLILADSQGGLTAPLTLSRLSVIHRRVRLARVAGLPVEDLEALIGMWERDPFADPASANDFLDLAARVAASSFSVAQLDYLLRHRTAPGSIAGLDDRTIVLLLHDLAAAASPASAAGAGDSPTPPGPAGPDDLVAQKAAPAVGLDVTTAAVLLGLPVPGETGTVRDALTDPRLAAALRAVLADPGAAGVPGAATAALGDQRFPGAYRAVRLLHKCALLAKAFGLRAADVTWWIAEGNTAALSWLRPEDLPVTPGTARTLGRWDAMQQFATFAARLAPGPLRALDFVAGVLAAGDDYNPIADFAELTSWPAGEIEWLVRAFGWLREILVGIEGPDGEIIGFVPQSDLSTLRVAMLAAPNLTRLADCFATLRRFGVAAARALSWATAAPGADVADGVRQAVKAKYDPAQWQTVETSLQDTLRERRRDALVSWLIANPALGRAVTDVAGLYGHVLIDVETGACMRTSRIRQAAASAQLFAQRCLLGQEPQVSADPQADPKWQQWTWMARYRTWEANRQIFLYPENWLEPELRHEKSPMFRQLERDLLQTDLTGDAAEHAFAAYLDRLAGVANLEIRTVAYAPSGDPAADVLHVIGRGRGRHGASYHYRRQIGGARWTPWEEIGLKIDGDHLVAAVDRDRLLLFWPQFVAQGEAPAQVTTPSAAAQVTVAAPTRYWDVRLHWSTYQQGAWSPQVLSQPALITYDNPANVGFRVLPYLNDPPGIKVEFLSESPDPASFAPQGYEFFRRTGEQLVTLSNPHPAGVLNGVLRILAPPQAQYAGSLIQHTQHLLINPPQLTLFFGYDTVALTTTEGGLGPATAKDSVGVLGRISPNTTFTVLRSDASAPTAPPDHAFVWDEAHTYHVEYRRTQTVSSTEGTSTDPVLVSTWNLRFAIHYHPFLDAFVATVDTQGSKGLFDREVQLQTGAFDFAGYEPTAVVQGPLPLEEVDFSYAGAYSPYNWELFFHVPVLIGNRLAAQHRYAEAMRWYQAVFDPTGPAGTTGADPQTPQQRFWITKPFYLTGTAQYRAQQIEAVLQALAAGDQQLLQQVRQWQADPFNPHLVAGLRTVAYQKYVVVRYVQTLLDWGDQLFAENTYESLNEATQLYVMAASLLGPRPQAVARRTADQPLTYYQLAGNGSGSAAATLDAVENLLPAAGPGAAGSPATPDPPQFPGGYFGVPGNDRILGLWDTAADRLFKIRHCRSLAGQDQQLPLFEPPIDPGLLAKAVAAGVDIASATAPAETPLPLYRFRTALTRARELCAQVRTLGVAMLAALEKRDAEALALLRSEHGLAMLAQARAVRAQQVDEAAAARAALQAARAVAEARRGHYARLIAGGVNTNEQAALDRNTEAALRISQATDLELISAALKLIPDLIAGVTGFGGSPTVTVQFGGNLLGAAAEIGATVKKSQASILQIGAGQAAVRAGYTRRGEEWELQQQIAERDLDQIDQQIAAADLRHAIAERELANHDLQSARAAAEDEYLRNRFTGQELYGWMIAQVSTVYQQSYQLAYDLARRAESGYRYELGLPSSNEIQFDAWDGLRRGILAGERLSLDVERLEAAFDRGNTRRLELTKHVSVARLDPVALLALRRNGECRVDIPEAVFDLDYPGHYARRLRHVELTIPCVAGPYTTLACTLTLTGSTWRSDPTLTGGTGYVRTGLADHRFRDEPGTGRSIATSTAQRDSGLFEPSTRDDRYLPFEGAGAVSSWLLRINRELPQLDPDTITDVILHLQYTALDAGESLRAAAISHVRSVLGGTEPLDTVPGAPPTTGSARIFDLKREFPDQWHRFRGSPSDAGAPGFVLTDLPDRLPLVTTNFRAITVSGLALAARLVAVAEAGPGSAGPEPGCRFDVATPTAARLTLNLTADDAFAGLVHDAQPVPADVTLPGSWTLTLDRPPGPGAAPAPAAIDELFLIISYTLAD